MSALTPVLFALAVLLSAIHFATTYKHEGRSGLALQIALFGVLIGLVLIAQNALEAIFPETPAKVSMFLLALFLASMPAILLILTNLKRKDSKT